MSRKSITFLNAETDGGNVSLSWYTAAPFCNEKADSEFESFSIFRKECDDFGFGEDYQEYFDGMSSEDAELIYRGALGNPIHRPGNRTKYTFIDQNVKGGSVYAYFVASMNYPPAGPAPVKVRDSGVWWSYDELKRRIDALCMKYPDLVKVEICGRTVEGREIFSLRVGQGSPFLGLLGAVHPGEAGPELIISALEKYLEYDPAILKVCSVVAIPSLNIDMRERLAHGNPWYLRSNAAGIDLNRNFVADWENVSDMYGFSTDDRSGMTFRGTSPASEPETIAAMNFFEKNKPACIFSFHALAGICGLPAFASGGVEKTNKRFYDITRYFGMAYGAGLYPEMKPDGSWVCYPCSEGSFPRWCWQKLGVPGFDLELSPKIAPAAFEMGCKDRTDQLLLNEYAEKHCNAIENIMKLKG